MSGEEKSLNNFLDTAFNPFRTHGDKALKIYFNVQKPSSIPLGDGKEDTGRLRDSLYLSGKVLSAH